MEPIELAQTFIDTTALPPSSQVLIDNFQQALRNLGFKFFACCSHVDPLRPQVNGVMLHNYPAEWVRRFSEYKLYEIDPVLIYAEHSLLPFSWADPVFRARLTDPQLQILKDAEQFGLVGGYTIPIHQPRSSGAPTASCSVVPESDAPDTQRYFAVQLMAVRLYEAARRELHPQPKSVTKTPLSPRERECLELAALGKDNWTIGQLLRISEHTVHRHIESAKRRLGVATRVQAILAAGPALQVSFGDVTRVGEVASRSDGEQESVDV